MKRSSIWILLITTALLFFSSCKKENTQVDYNPDVNSSKDLIYTEDIYIEIFNLFYKCTQNDSILNGEYGYIDNCSVIYEEGENKMYFGYGEVNRWCFDGKFRRNMYAATFNGPPEVTGTAAVVEIDSLFVDNDLVQAEIEITRLGVNADNNPEWSVKLNQGKVTIYGLEDTVTLEMDFDYLLTQTEGAGTPSNYEDDVFEVTGTSNGISRNKDSYSAMISNALQDRLDCFWIVSGRHQISVSNGGTEQGTIDYITDDGCNYRVDFYFDENLFFDYLKHQ